MDQSAHGQGAIRRFVFSLSNPTGYTPVHPILTAEPPQRRIVATRLAGLAAAATQLGDGPVLMLVGEVYEDQARRAEVEPTAVLPVLQQQARGC